MIDINTIGVGVDTKEVKTAARDLDSFGKSADKASREADKLGSASKKTESSMSGLASGVSRAAIGIAAFSAALIASGLALSRQFDEHTKYTAQLKLATRSQDEFKAALADSTRIANTAQASVSSIATLYARLNSSMRDLGATQAETARVTETVALALKVSGATAGESSSAMLQLSQAFGSGVLRGEEFNALMESSPALMRALAESIGVPVGKLRELASEGLITGDVLTKAFGDQKLLDKFREQAKEVETISGNVEVLKNKWMELVASVKPLVLPIVIKLIEGTTGALNVLNFALFGKAKKGSVVDMADNFFTPLGGKVLNAFGVDTAAQKSANAARRGAAAKNNLFGGIDFTSGNYAPDFNSGVQAQDVDKIHKQQEILDKANQQAYDKQRDLAKKLYDEKLKEIQDEFAFEDEILGIQQKQKIEGEEELRKEKEKTQKAWFDLEQKNIDAAQKERDKAFEQEQRNLEKLAAEQKEMAHEFSSALTNGLFDSFKKGESFGKAMLSNLLALAKTWAARLFDGLLSPIGSSIASAFTGGAASLFSGGASASTGGGASLGGFASITDAVMKGNAGIISGIESLGTFLSTGTGGLGDMIGGALGQYAGQIANVLPFAGAAFNLLTGDVKGAISQGVGAGIGLAVGGPVGGIVGAVASSLLGGFGGEHVIRKKFYANASVGSSGTNILSAYGNSDTSGSERAFAIGPANSFADAILQYAKAFGASVDRFTLGVNYQQKYNAYLLSIGSAITKNGANADVSFSADKSADGLAQAFLVAVKKGFINLPDYISGILNKSKLNLGEAQGNVQLVADIKKIGDALKDLPPIFDAISYSLNSSVTLKNVDLLKSQFTAIGTFTSLFYTQAEQFDTFTKQITTQFDGLNTVLPKSRDEYRALVDGIKVTDESTSNLFNGLVALAPAMDAFFKQVEQLNSAVSRDSFNSLLDFQRYQGVAANYGTTFASDYTSNLEAGRIMVDANGVATTQSGNTSLLAEVKMLRTAVEAVAVSTSKTVSELKKYYNTSLPVTVVTP